MAKLPRVTGKQVISALKKVEFEIIHIRGSHHYLRRPQGSKLITVPVHSGEILPPKTLQSILEQADLTVEQLIELL